jgi:hypothetical protein
MVPSRALFGSVDKRFSLTFEIPMKKFVFLLILFFFNCRANAEGAFTGKITEIQFFQGHFGVLVALDNMGDPDKCGRADHLIVADMRAHYKDMYALLLVQKLIGSPVRLHISGCVQGLPSIVHIVA